jgi:FlaA1/EpsC-like NDP-sugar epimerase
MVSRLLVRIWSERNSGPVMVENGVDKILIVGAGISGHSLLKDLVRNPSLGTVVGFVDDDGQKIGRELMGVPVLGKIDLIPDIAQANGISKVFIAIPTASGKLLERVIEKCNQADVIVKTLPKVTDIYKNKSVLAQLRTVTPEDLLGREEVSLDESTLKKFFYQKVVLVTGAGGSIGSEISRQIAGHAPKLIVLFEQNEFNIYQVEMDLKNNFPEQKLITILGDVRDREIVKQVFETYRPDFVYHAAAYKHVPMVEKNPYEGVKTNVLGTKNVANCAAEYAASKFVLISTDKAVNPTNIMGATKRVAEIAVQFIAKKKPQTKYSIVRFGNVLGSSGSVIPLFKKQIEDGGPITLTHESIERYFMSIPEATRLVIQASVIGNGGEIFVLDMGSAVKIIDLARKMITLSGLKEGRDIKIKVVGLRPGEKLYEELLADKEETITTAIPKIRIAKAREASEADNELIEVLTSLNQKDTVTKFRDNLKSIVPEYTPVIIPENQQAEWEGTCT